MKCRKCGGGAALELRRHNAAFCREHFIEFFRKQVAEAVHGAGRAGRDDDGRGRHFHDGRAGDPVPGAQPGVVVDIGVDVPVAAR